MLNATRLVGIIGHCRILRLYLVSCIGFLSRTSEQSQWVGHPRRAVPMTTEDRKDVTAGTHQGDSRSTRHNPPNSAMVP